MAVSRTIERSRWWHTAKCSRPPRATVARVSRHRNAGSGIAGRMGARFDASGILEPARRVYARLPVRLRKHAGNTADQRSTARSGTAFSPDGKTLAFVRDRQGAARRSISTSKQEQLLHRLHRRRIRRAAPSPGRPTASGSPTPTATTRRCATYIVVRPRAGAAKQVSFLANGNVNGAPVESGRQVPHLRNRRSERNRRK